jgi:hypothetical protein
MRFLQSTSKARLIGSDRVEREEAVLELTAQERPILQVLERLSLGVEHALYSLDDLSAAGQKQPEQYYVRLKRHLAKTLAIHHRVPSYMGKPILPERHLNEQHAPGCISTNVMLRRRLLMRFQKFEPNP